MFEKNVIAIYGYENGGANLEGSSAGQKIFAYVNGQGIRALGIIKESIVRPGIGVFLDKDGKQLPEEYHLSVEWQVILPVKSALSNSQASSMGYSLPVRSVFGRLHRGRLATQIESEIKKRSS